MSLELVFIFKVEEGIASGAGQSDEHVPMMMAVVGAENDSLPGFIATDRSSVFAHYRMNCSSGTVLTKLTREDRSSLSRCGERCCRCDG